MHQECLPQGVEIKRSSSMNPKAPHLHHQHSQVTGALLLPPLSPMRAEDHHLKLDRGE